MPKYRVTLVYDQPTIAQFDVFQADRPLDAVGRAYDLVARGASDRHITQIECGPLSGTPKNMRCRDIKDADGNIVGHDIDLSIVDVEEDVAQGFIDYLNEKATTP